MEKWQGWPKIQFESELDPGFADEIASIPGGEKLFSCIQCGTCSGMCPLSPCMDHTPRQIIAMIRGSHPPANHCHDPGRIQGGCHVQPDHLAVCFLLRLHR
jgi:ferredoxin